MLFIFKNWIKIFGKWKFIKKICLIIFEITTWYTIINHYVLIFQISKKFSLKKSMHPLVISLPWCSPLAHCFSLNSWSLRGWRGNTVTFSCTIDATLQRCVSRERDFVAPRTCFASSDNQKIYLFLLLFFK